MKKIPLMSHLVAGFPSLDVAFAAAEALIEGGTDFLEIQLPFSDPSADGCAIANACTQTLAKGLHTQHALDWIANIHHHHPDIPVALMSYASLIFTPGVEVFCQRAKKAGVSFLIVPDLPFDCDENLRNIAQSLGMQMIPVAAPSMSEARLNQLLSQNFSIIYAALRRGITGEKTILTQETCDFLKKIKTSGAQILGGFGISDGQTAKQIAPLVDYVVAGSVFVRLIEQYQNQLPLLREALIQKARELSGHL